MEIWDHISLALSLVLALFASWTLLLPFFQGESAPSSEVLKSTDLLLKKESLLDSLEDLEQDFRAGKVTEADYIEAKEELVLQASEVYNQLGQPEAHIQTNKTSAKEGNAS